MQGKKQLKEKLFLQFQLSDRVPEDNFYRRLDKVLDLSFLRKETSQYYGKEGQASIDPVVFFKLILVGYLENLESDRKIIENSRLRLDILYYLGYDLDEELPWHSTLSRTRQLYGIEVFDALFAEVLRLCVEKGMVQGKRQAVDSAYIKANASMDSLVERKVIEDGREYLNKLRENTDVPQQKVEIKRKEEIEPQGQADKSEQKDADTGSQGAQYDEHGNMIRPQNISNEKYYSKTDPDARVSTKPGKARQLTYSAQTAVDTKKHVITGIVADYSDKRDGKSLPELLDKTRKNLSMNDLFVEEIMTDTGYSQADALIYLEDHHIAGYIPNHPKYKAEHKGFEYNSTLDQFECQKGNKALLLYRFTYQNSEKTEQTKVYRSSQTSCKNCPLREQCLGLKNKSKKITTTIHKPLYDRMHQRMKSIKAKRMISLRGSTVEAVLGTLINFRGMRRVRTRGIKQANKFMIGAATAYNLKKWLNYNPKPVKSAVATLKIEKNKKKEQLTLSFCFFRPYHPPYGIAFYLDKKTCWTQFGPFI